jgi:hypothetical protein
MGLSSDGWTPVRLDESPAGLRVDWCYTDGYDFDDPFFDQTVERCLREPARLLFRRSTPLSALTCPAAPNGLIAHISRCGSTMVTQVLAARGDVVAWSEPPIVDQVVRVAAAGACGPDAVRGVLGELAARGRPASVVKLDAWASLDLSVVRQAAPDVPLVMMVRDPLEVLVSQAGRRGYHMIPGALPPEQLGLRPGDQPEPDEYGAIVLGRLLEVAHATLTGDHRALVVDYTELPAAVDRIATHFGLQTTPEQARTMTQAAARNAKNPVLPFAPDTEQKQHLATAQMRASIDRWAQPWYERLLQLRGR